MRIFKHVSDIVNHLDEDLKVEDIDLGADKRLVCTVLSLGNKVAESRCYALSFGAKAGVMY